MAEENSTHGVKRKRFEAPEKDLGVKIAGKLHHDLKEVRKAAKKAKAFETQKLVKKLKGLRLKGDATGSINDSEEQLEALKRTDHEPIANTALKTKLNKDRLLSENEHIQAAISKELATNLLAPATSGTPAAKVQSRLLSSKLLAVEVANAVQDLKAALLPKPEATEGNEEEEEHIERPKKVKKVGSVETAKSRERPILPEASGSVSEDEGEGEGEQSDAGGWESGTVAEDSEEEEDDLPAGRKRPLVSDGSNSTGDSSDDELQVKVKAPTKKVAAPSAKPKAATAQSTFLPSLAVGFVRGGSEDSDWSDSEAKIADGDQKKNRRGQRARRAIWEKKFGRNANHVKEEAKAAETIKKSSSASVPSAGKDKPQYHQGKDSGWSKRPEPTNNVNTSRNVPSAPPPRWGARPTAQPEEKPLHPSWEAKRKLKEKESAGIVPSQGKKIVFT